MNAFHLFTVKFEFEESKMNSSNESPQLDMKASILMQKYERSLKIQYESNGIPCWLLLWWYSSCSSSSRGAFFFHSTSHVVMNSIYISMGWGEGSFIFPLPEERANFFPSLWICITFHIRFVFISKIMCVLFLSHSLSYMARHNSFLWLVESTENSNTYLHRRLRRN